jgi:hypothetical protein
VSGAEPPNLPGTRTLPPDPSSQSLFRYESLRARLNESLVAAGFCGTAGAVAALGVGMPGAVLVLATTLAVSVWAIRRAFRLSLEASSDHVVVRNYWRVYEINWIDVAEVGLGELAMGPAIATGPAVAFVLRNGKVIHAQSTPVHENEQDRIFGALAELAPPSVKFLHAEHAEEQPRRRSIRWRVIALCFAVLAVISVSSDTAWIRILLVACGVVVVGSAFLVLRRKHGVRNPK